MTPSNSSPPPDVLTVPLVGHLYDDDDNDVGPEISSISMSSSTSRRPAPSPPRRSTAISYECGSLTYFSALLEQMNDDDDDDNNHNAHNHNVDTIGNNHRIPAADGGRLLQKIQDRLIKKHVRNGTIRPKTISIVPDDDRQAASVVNRASAPAASATASHIRRGRRRIGSDHRPIMHGETRADRDDASTKSRIVYSFRSGARE